MKFQTCRYLICSDIYRHHGRYSRWLLLKELLRGVGGRYCIWLRLSRYLEDKGMLWFPLYVIVRLIQNHYLIKFGFDIKPRTKIGPGLYLGHFGQVVINADSIIGRNCNLSQGVTFGVSSRGAREGCPTIGDNVFIGPGAKIIGRIRIGNNVAVGANCVVTRDVPDNSVVVGIPGKVISQDGSEGYILKADYDSPPPDASQQGAA